MSSKSSKPIITHPENEYRFLPPQPQSRLRKKNNVPLLDWIVKRFENIPEDRLLFGSLVYPKPPLSYRVNILSDLSHFSQRMFRQVPRRRFGERQIQRTFITEQNEEAGRHAHFILEVPPGMSLEAMMKITTDIWRQIALRGRHEKEYWTRLNRGIRYSDIQPRNVLVKNGVIPRVEFAPNSIVRDSTSYRDLAVVKPVTPDAGGLRGAVDYLLKGDGKEATKESDESGELVVEKSTAKWIKGHNPSLSL